MAYSDYTFSKLEENFGIRQESSFLFVQIPIEPIIICPIIGRFGRWANDAFTFRKSKI
jgi:hypothetical protein